MGCRGGLGSGRGRITWGFKDFLPFPRLGGLTGSDCSHKLFWPWRCSSDGESMRLISAVSGVQVPASPPLFIQAGRGAGFLVVERRGAGQRCGPRRASGGAGCQRRVVWRSTGREVGFWFEKGVSCSTGRGPVFGLGGQKQSGLRVCCLMPARWGRFCFWGVPGIGFGLARKYRGRPLEKEGLPRWFHDRFSVQPLLRRRIQAPMPRAEPKSSMVPGSGVVAWGV